MFGKTKDPATASRTTGAGLSIIASGVAITGDIVANGEIQLDGAVTGDIRCDGLSMGEQGRLDGTLTVDSAVIRGTVNGAITARTVMLERTARIVGDITHESISIEAGARVEGRFIHGKPEKPADAAGPKLVPEPTLKAVGD